MDYCSKLAITVVASFIFSLKLAIKNHMACLSNYGFYFEKLVHYFIASKHPLVNAVNIVDSFRNELQSYILLV